MIASIIIPTRNRPEDLRRCLELLKPQLGQGGDIEIIVCDDSSNPATRNLVSQDFPDAHLHAGPQTGPGANRNVGARVAKGQWLIFLDDDCLPHSTLIGAYLAAFSSADQRTVFAGPTLRSDERRDSLLWEAPRSAAPRESLPPSCNFAIPRELYLQAGGFDERYRISFEDMEFFARLELQGVAICFLPGAEVEHPSRPLPPAASLARRWEARVISSFDYGASTGQVLWHLPRHIFMVILSRFRGRKFSRDSLKAASVFAMEFLICLASLPGWVVRYGKSPRSAFWKQMAADGKTPRRFGL